MSAFSHGILVISHRKGPSRICLWYIFYRNLRRGYRTCRMSSTCSGISEIGGPTWIEFTDASVPRRRRDGPICYEPMGSSYIGIACPHVLTTRWTPKLLASNLVLHLFHHVQGTQIFCGKRSRMFTRLQAKCTILSGMPSAQSPL